MKAYLVFFMYFITIATPAIADVTKEQADQFCHSYIQKPQSFKKADITECEIVSSYNDNEKIKAECFDYNDPSTNAVRKFSILRGDGTCSSDYIAEIAKDGKKIDLPTRNEDVNGYGFGSDDRILLYKNQLFVTNGNDLRLVQGNEQIILCNFAYQSSGWKKAEPEQNPVCKKFGEDQFETNVRLINNEDRDLWPEYPEASPIALYQSDLDGNGEAERVLAYEYTSGRGCGCDSYILTLFDESQLVCKEHFRNSQSVRTPMVEQLEELTSKCNRLSRPTSIVHIDGKDYVLFDYSYRYGDEEMKISYEEPIRELYQYQSGGFKKVCSQRAQAKKVIMHEVYAKPTFGLNYIPLE